MITFPKSQTTISHSQRVKNVLIDVSYPATTVSEVIKVIYKFSDCQGMTVVGIPPKNTVYLILEKDTSQFIKLLELLENETIIKTEETIYLTIENNEEI